MDLLFAGTQEEFEAELQAGRIQKTETGFDISIENKIELFQEDKLLAVLKIDGKDIYWNPAKERDPRILGNKNGGDGGAGFRFSPYFHSKGQFLQDVAKAGMIKAIDTAHTKIVGNYDEDAYNYEDPRLIELNTFLRSFIGEHFGDAGTGPRKLDFMYQLADIILFLMKEDIFYRARFLQLFNEVPGNWELTEPEKQNLKNWD